MNKSEILSEIFGGREQILSESERGIALEVLDWAERNPTLILSTEGKNPTEKVIAAAESTLVELYGIHLTDVIRNDRRRPEVDLRKWCMIEMSGRTRMTQNEIGKIMGRHRSAVSNSKTIVYDLCKVDKNYRAEHDAFVQKFNEYMK